MENQCTSIPFVLYADNRLSERNEGNYLLLIKTTYVGISVARTPRDLFIETCHKNERRHR